MVYLHENQSVATLLNHGHLLLVFIDVMRGLLTQLKQSPADLARTGGGEALPQDGLHDPGDGREAALLLHCTRRPAQGLGVLIHWRAV